MTGDAGEGGLAPVIPLFPERAAERWDASWIDDPPARTVAADDEDRVSRAESVLLRKLRARPLSVTEAEGILRGEDAPGPAVAELLARFVDLGYLDDAALAERLVELATGRRGQGRHMIAQTLARRGIPRPLADAALAGLPDDEDERALEFARTKARAMRGLDTQTALRRLTGQLARRGYASSVALAAARRALEE
ncbi:regulatory protein RecX [Microbacterium sp. X-17]|uniref:regulatory protein RecX n=1 Tax=Microbacterium sp. X-17 TaxID=3144404 RepID=UPI0031F4F260